MLPISRRDFLQNSAFLAAALATSASEPKTTEAMALAAAPLALVNDQMTLLGESGPPMWWHWQPRHLKGKTMLDHNQVFRVSAGRQPALLELLPEAPQHFRLRSRVQHCAGQPLGQVGIYFGHGARRTEDGARHCIFKLAFNDHFDLLPPQVKGAPAQNQVGLTFSVYREKEGAVFSRQLDTTCALSQWFTPAGAVDPKPWRSLEVEVTPEWIRAFWEGVPIRTFEVDGCDPKTPLELASRLMGNPMVALPNDQAPPPRVIDIELALGGGLGLYVEQGVAAFQSVVIEPLFPG